MSSDSIWGVLHREGHRLFPDSMFDDLFSSRGRRSVPPQVVATVMVLQRLHGMSDREAVEMFEFDVRAKYACGLDLDFPGFSHTVLVDMRARLAASERPRRIFEVVLDAARDAGLIGHRRVLDSTPLYDAVATMDTVTLVRSAIRGLLAVADDVLEAELRSALVSGDDYSSAGKPRIDWDDPAARQELIDGVARDGFACLAVVTGQTLSPAVSDAGELLATVLGQDIDQDDDGVFRIVWGVAPDRVISTVDPQARHGHKTQARGFDGFKGHAGIDPDSELITATKVTPGNVGDGEVAQDLITDLTTDDPRSHDDANDDNKDEGEDEGEGEGGMIDAGAVPVVDPGTKTVRSATGQTTTPAGKTAAKTRAKTPGKGRGKGRSVGPAQRANQKLRAKQRAAKTAARPKVYGDSAYGTGPFQQHLTDHGIDSRCRTQSPAPRPGALFGKDLFRINLDDDTVTCPAGDTTDITRNTDGDGIARFDSCGSCPMRETCTTSMNGRTIKVGVHQAALAEARHAQTEPGWKDDYRSVRPKVERKLGHLMFRRHGGRRARVRGTAKIDADFNLLAAAHNLARLARLGIQSTPTGWATT